MVSLISKGDELAFQQFFHLYKNKVFSFTFHYTGRPELAEELVQDIFMQVWNHKEELPGIENIDSWLFTISRNLSFNALRKLANEGVLFKNWEAKHSTTADEAQNILVEKQYDQILQQATEQLPARQKQIYILSRQQNLSYDEIASKTGLSRKTVKKNIVLALKSLRKYILPRLPLLIFFF